jgi:hypothetical protein
MIDELTEPELDELRKLLKDVDLSNCTPLLSNGEVSLYFWSWLEPRVSAVSLGRWTDPARVFDYVKRLTVVARRLRGSRVL